MLLLVYIPMSYYTDLFLYRRRQAKELQGGGGDKREEGRLVVDVRMFTVGPVQENCFLLRRAADADRAVLVDPGDEADKLLKALDEFGVTLDAILLTHTHFDHVGAVAPVARATGAPVYCPVLETHVLADIMSFVPWEGFGPFECWDAEQTVAGGERLAARGLRHRRASSRPATAPATSPTRSRATTRTRTCRSCWPPATCCSRPRSAAPTCRAATTRRCWRSIADLLERYDDDTVVLPGHMGVTTLGAERATNPFLQDLPARQT